MGGKTAESDQASASQNCQKRCPVKSLVQVFRIHQKFSPLLRCCSGRLTDLDGKMPKLSFV
jgi:hypothetical protein